MKFSGMGNAPLHDLKKYLKEKKKNRKKRQAGQAGPKEARPGTSAPKRAGQAGPKEARPGTSAPKRAGQAGPKAVRPSTDAHKLIEQNFTFEDTRKFPLQGGVTYRPDYILMQTRDGKKIIIHIDEDVTAANISKYRMFMKMARNAYHVIMVVNDCQLRTWNENNRDKRLLFDDIWTIDNVKEMINSIKNPHRFSSKTNTVVCRICHRRASDPKKIKNNFSYRTETDGSLTVQPYCRRCQKGIHVRKVRTPKSFAKCIGCRMSFKTEIASQLYCNSCKNKFVS